MRITPRFSTWIPTTPMLSTALQKHQKANFWYFNICILTLHFINKQTGIRKYSSGQFFKDLTHQLLKIVLIIQLCTFLFSDLSSHAIILETNIGEELQSLTYDRHLRSLGSEGFLTCNTSCHYRFKRLGPSASESKVLNQCVIAAVNFVVQWHLMLQCADWRLIVCHKVEVS